jgi:hypothetical protein
MSGVIRKSAGLSMNSSILIVALSTAAVVLGFVLFRLFCAAGQTTAVAGLGRGRKLSKNWRRWLFGEHNIPFN